jgi:ribosome-binding factor A
MGLRQTRLADEIRDVLAESFSAGQLSDPRVSQVTITAVKLSPDLQQASVYFRIYGEPNALAIAEAKAGLDSAQGFLRRRVAEAIRDLRRVPSLRFFFDESVERGSRIESLLSKI